MDETLLIISSKHPNTLLSGNGRTSPVFQTSNADTGKQENIVVAIKNVATY